MGPALVAGLRFALARAAVLFGFANRRQDVGDAQVELPPLHVDANDLHLHTIAQAEDAPGVLAAQDVLPLDEPVIVIRHRRHVHQTFDEMLHELDEQSECGDAGDVAVELVTDLVGHEADFLPLHQLPLGVVGAALALRGVARDFRQILRQLLDAVARHPLPRLAQRAVDDEVRVSADRRREVRVAARREAEVPHVRRVVAGFLHRPEHQERDRLLLRLARNPLHQLLEVPRAHGVGPRRQAVAHGRDELFELRHLQRIRRFVNAI